MLDSDLARLYGVETGALNRAAKRNGDRFPEDFRCVITGNRPMRSGLPPRGALIK